MNKRIQTTAVLTVLCLLLTSYAAMCTLSSGSSETENIAEETEYDIAAELIANAINNTTVRTGLHAESVDGVLTIFSDGEAILIFDPIRGIVPVDQLIMPMVAFIVVLIPMIASWVAPALVVAFLAGAAVGYLIGMNAPSASGNQDEIDLAFRYYESEIIFRTTNTVSELLDQLLTMDSDLLRLTELYFNRLMEVTAASYWSENTAYYSEALLEYSGVADYIMTYAYNYAVCIEQPFYQFRNVRGDWYTESAFDSMIYSFVSDTANTNILSPTVKSNFSASNDYEIYMDACQLVKPTATNNKVYLDTQLGDAYYKTSTTIYVMGAGSGTVTILDAGGYEYQLSYGINDLTAIRDTTSRMSLESGWYTLQTGPIYCGPFFSSADSDTVAVTGGLMLVDSGSYAFVYYNEQDYTVIRSNGSESRINDVVLRVSYDGDDERKDSDGNSNPARTSLGGIIKGYRSLINAQTAILINSAQAGKVTWDLYSYLFSSGALTETEFNALGLLSPSAIAFSRSADLNEEELKLLYLSALNQLSAAGGKLDLSDLKFSAASFHTYYYGSVYYKGQMVAENAIFTLISYLPETIRLDSGQRINWPGAGLLVVWAMDLTSYEEWDGNMNIDDSWIVYLDSQFQIDTGYIFVDGVATSSVTLRADTMERMGLLDIDDYRANTNVPQTTDISDIIFDVIIAMLVILVLLFISLRIGGPAGIMLALIVLIVGAIYILTISGILSDWTDGLLPWPLTMRLATHG